MNRDEPLQEKIKASLMGGAIGDALGYTVEFMGRIEIMSRFGAAGLTELQVDRRTGKAYISDDTQMTLFTADGLLWAGHRSLGADAIDGLYPSYMRWYYTQQGRMPFPQGEMWLERQPHEMDFSLMDQEELFARRAPGATCLTALESGIMGTIKSPLNQSKGCGGVMRVAPVGLRFSSNPAKAFQIGAEAAAITHGHPTGYLSAGAFAAIIAELISGKELSESVITAQRLLTNYRGHDETLRALEQAVAYAQDTERPETAITELGEGWVADEALAIGVYCALKRREFRHALRLAVNHSGDSDSTGSICGNLIGAYSGMDAIPEEWAERIELRQVIEKTADRLTHLIKQNHRESCVD